MRALKAAVVPGSRPRQGEEAAEEMQIKLIEVGGLTACAARTSVETGMAVEKRRRQS